MRQSCLSNNCLGWRNAVASVSRSGLPSHAWSVGSPRPRQASTGGNAVVRSGPRGIRPAWRDLTTHLGRARRRRGHKATREPIALCRGRRPRLANPSVDPPGHREGPPSAIIRPARTGDRSWTADSWIRHAGRITGRRKARLTHAGRARGCSKARVGDSPASHRATQDRPAGLST